MVTFALMMANHVRLKPKHIEKEYTMLNLNEEIIEMLMLANVKPADSGKFLKMFKLTQTALNYICDALQIAVEIKDVSIIEGLIGSVADMTAIATGRKTKDIYDKLLDIAPEVAKEIGDMRNI